MAVSRARILVALAALSLGATVATTAAGQSQAPNPAAAQADALIAQVPNGGQLFRATASGAVVHIQSGMVCVPGAEQMRLSKLVVGAVGRPGDDVACDYTTPTGKTTVFATLASGQTVQQAGAAIVRALQNTFPDARPASAPLVASYPGLSDPLAASFLVTWNGRPGVTSLWVSQQGDWLVEVRATYSNQARHDAELLAAMASVNAASTIKSNVH